MGLLDFNDPQQAGMLALATGLLDAGAPSRVPVSLGQALGRGLNGMQQAQMQAELMQRKKQEQEMQMQMQQMQMEQAQKQIADQKAMEQALMDRFRARQQSQPNQSGQRSFLSPSQIDGGEFYRAAQKHGLSTDNDSLNRIVNLVGQGYTPDSAAASLSGRNAPSSVQGYSMPTAQSQNDRVSGNYQAPPVPQMQAPQAPQMQQGFTSRGDLVKSQIASLMQDAEAYSKMDSYQAQMMAQQAKQQAIALSKELPKYSLDFKQATDANNQLRNYVLADDGTWKDSGLGVAPKFREINRGGITTVVNENKLGDFNDFNHVIDPSTAANVRLARDRMEMEKQDKVDPTQVENVAGLIASGKMQALGSMAMRSPFGAAVMAKVAQLNPNYDAKDFATMGKAERDFATGKNGNSVRSFNVSISHLDTLGQLADALNNKDTQAINKIGNFFSTQSGQPAPTNFEAAKKIVGDEIVKAIVGSGGGVTDREEAAKTIAAANSPAQLKGVINTYKELMVGQLGGLEKQYQATTGKKDFQDRYLSDAARNVYGAHNQQPAQAQQNWQQFYNNKQEAVSDARNAILKNPAAKAQIIQRLEAAGITDHGLK